MFYLCLADRYTLLVTCLIHENVKLEYELVYHKITLQNN